MKNIMKRKNVFWATLACVAMAGLMASCNKEDANGTNVSDYPTLIVGKWNLVCQSGSYNGGPFYIDVADSAYGLIEEFTADGYYHHSPFDYPGDTENIYCCTTSYWVEGNTIFFYVWDENGNVTEEIDSMLISHLDRQKLIIHGEVHDEEENIIQDWEFQRMTE